MPDNVPPLATTCCTVPKLIVGAEGVITTAEGIGLIATVALPVIGFTQLVEALVAEMV